MNNQRRMEKYSVFVITLDHAQERRDTIAARLCELALPFEFLPGVDGRKLELLSHSHYEPIKRRLFYGRDLSNGEFGCVLAHRNVYQHIVDNEIPVALVLEDDATLTNDLPAVIGALLNEKENWDLVRFLGREKNYRSSRILKAFDGLKANLTRPHGIPGGAYGYLLNLHAARRLLTMTQKNWLAIDTLHGVTWLTGLKTLSVVPSPVLPNDDIPSCIDEQDDSQRWDKSVRLPVWQRAVYPLTRGVWKLYLNGANTMVWAGTWLADRRLRKSSKTDEKKCQI